jgi:pimeloyl-ACP methyl ester carboxylesterase
MTTLLVPTDDGRQLDVEVHGPDGAPLVLVQHGTPGGRALATPYRAAADALGVRLAIWARPGYGRSTRLPGRRVADVVPDACAVASALGADRFATVGGSGGGPHALAVGALAPDRCVAVATIAAVAPWDAEGLDPLAGMGEGNVEEFGAAIAGEAALRPLLDRERGALVGGGVDGLAQGMRSVLSPPDVAALTGEVAREAFEDMDRALAGGVDGWLDDDLAFVRPWGFAPEDLRVPVHLWQGGQDLMVPPAHGDWLAARVPGVHAHLLPGEGHLTLHVTRVADVLAPLAEALGA